MEKILIVEDEKPISELIWENLTKAGYGCTCVYDGKAAADLGGLLHGEVAGDLALGF